MKQIPCRKSKVQCYECQVSRKIPFEENKRISFDACLSRELFYLWDKGIETTGSCCGKHVNLKKGMAYIGVIKEDIPKMKELGYKVAFNHIRPNDEDSFIPKTKL